jgi:hypothetical protein
MLAEWTAKKPASAISRNWLYANGDNELPIVPAPHSTAIRRD